MKEKNRLALRQIKYFLRSVQNGDNQATNAHIFIRLVDNMLGENK